MEAFSSRQEAFSWILDDPEIQRMYCDEADAEQATQKNEIAEDDVASITEKVPMTAKDFKLRIKFGRKKKD